MISSVGCGDLSSASTIKTTSRRTRVELSTEYQYFHGECALCGRLQENAIGDESRLFQFCGKCRVVVYCSRDHQIADWKMHKRFCKENAWKRENPAVIVATVACPYLSCQCRSWVALESDGSAGTSTDLLEVSSLPSATFPNVPTTSTSEESKVIGSQNNESSQDYSSLRPNPLPSANIFRLNLGVGKTEVEITEGTISGPTSLEVTNYYRNNTSESSSADCCTVPSSTSLGGNIIAGQRDSLGQLQDSCEEQLISTSSTSSTLRKTPLKGGQTSRSHRVPVVDKSNNSNSNTSNNSSSSSSAVRSQILHQSHPPLEDLENHAPAATFGTVSDVFSSHVNSQLLGRTNHQHLLSSFQSQEGSTTQSDQSTRSCSTSQAFSGPTGVAGNTVGPPALSENASAADDINKDNESADSNLHNSVCNNVLEGIRPSMTSSSATIPFQHRNNMQPISGQTSQQQTRLWMLQVWQQVIEDMNRYGVCVVDNLLGEARGAAVLREVQSMYSSGAFQDGQLVKGKDNSQSKSIRGDKITWVDGREPNCKNIAVLIKLLDNIVMGANTFTNNGKLGTYRIKERSKAMVACYPGSGTHYVKHVDNPNDDGRCVTAIYYLNKDWNTIENGGLLRIFPEGWAHQVADIEPLFDRVIFFWSDRRNPHEVQPAFKTRYAITLWYFDSNAKERAKISTQSNKLPNLQAVS